METFKAEEKNIRSLFQEKITYTIPSYQRPYSWEKDKIEKFCEDIFLAYKEEDEYLLSSIILVEKKKNKEYEVIDGQQRLTTISIFLSVLKLFLNDDDNIEDIDIRILNGNEGVRLQRLQTDKSYHQDFQEILENFDYDIIKDKVKKKGNKKNNYFKNAIYIYDFFSDLKDKQFNFDDFYSEYFIDNVYLIRVYTSEESKAMRLFEVLNSRGLPLKNSDLIKNHIMERIYSDFDDDTKQNGIETFEIQWKDMKSNLDAINESMEDLFTYYIYFKLKENPKNNLFEEFKKIIANEYTSQKNIQDFTKDLNNFYKTFVELFDDQRDLDMYRKIQSMKYLREGRFWKVIFVAYKLSYKGESIDDNFKQLVNTMFQFYYLNYLAGESVNPYKQFSFNLIKTIVESGEIDFIELKTSIEEYYEKQKTIYRIASNLNGEIYREKWSKIIFYLIEYFIYKDDGDDEIFEKNNKKIQLEHIFPQNTDNWSDIIENDSDLMELKNSLGNLTLLFQSNNVKCSNYSFDKKKEIYKNAQKFEDIKETVLKNNDKWGSAEIKERKKKLLSQLEGIFDLKEGDLII